MKIVKPYAKMLSSQNAVQEFTLVEGIAILRRIEYAARVSHASEDSMSVSSYDRFLRSVVLQHGDMSVIEHEKVTCEFLVDRGITHEQVRHRIASYTQESTRFINYKKKGGEAKFIQPEFIYPESVDEFIECCIFVEERYMRMIERGEKPQIARAVLLTALASKIVVTMNLRSWRHFFIMRTSLEAHPQMKQVTLPLLEQFKNNIPILFEDIQPEQRQAKVMTLLR
jgi:thymidylate synthase (FAD)